MAIEGGLEVHCLPKALFGCDNGHSYGTTEWSHRDQTGPKGELSQWDGGSKGSALWIILYPGVGSPHLVLGRLAVVKML